MLIELPNLMNRGILVLIVVLCFFLQSGTVFGATPALVGRVSEAFLQVFGKNPTATEKAYWQKRVTAGEKKTYDALVGAMYYQKANAATAKAPTSAKATAGKENKKQLIIDVLPEFIKIFGNNPTDAEKAWWRKRISCDEIKTHDALTKSMNFHKAKKVRKGSDSICGGTGASGEGGVSTRPVSGVESHKLGNTIRVGIYGTDPAKGISLSVNGPFQIRAGEETLASLGTDDDVKVTWSGNNYHVRGSGLELDTDQPVKIVPTSGGIVKVASYSDLSRTYPGKNYNRFRGIIEVRKCEGCNELWAVNDIRVELYLRGLGETSGEGPEEYLKALGIAARTYALYHKVVTGGRNVARGYDIGSTASDQIYRGYEYELIAPRLASVFGTVSGIIVANSEGDVPISTVYFSDSDGHTRSAKEVWNSSRFPHLQSVADPHHASKSCLGHCVGMSAQGAYGFAKHDGWDWRKILSHYYKGVKFVKAY